MPVYLNELIRLHKAATEGRWNVQDFSPAMGSPKIARDVTISCSWPDHIGIASMSNGLTATLDEARANAAFIAEMKSACDDGLLERLREAERMSDLGCDAADGGPHTVMVQGRYNFCGKCGIIVKRPTLSERARAAEARVRATEAKLSEADSLVLLTAMRAEAAEASLAALKAENERLREALKPFADIGIGINPEYEPMLRMDRKAIVRARKAMETTNG